jgi:hypothetical protein
LIYLLALPKASPSAYLEDLIGSGNFGTIFFRGNLKLLSFDLANFSSISFLKSTSSASIFGLIYLGLYSLPQARAMMLPDDVFFSWTPLN